MLETRELMYAYLQESNSLIRTQSTRNNSPLTMQQCGYGNPLRQGGNLSCPRALVVPPESLQELVLSTAQLEEWEQCEAQIRPEHKAAAKRIFAKGGVLDVLLR